MFVLFVSHKVLLFVYIVIRYRFLFETNKLHFSQSERNREQIEFYRYKKQNIDFSLNFLACRDRLVRTPIVIVCKDISIKIR